MAGRIKANAKELIKELPEIIITDPNELIEKIPTDKEIIIEIGMGKGQFINELAHNSPKKIFIGIEIKEERCLSSANKAKALNNNNLIIFCGDFFQHINELKNINAKTIWFNFPDPWPKNRHEKRRLVNHNSIQIIKQMLAKNGNINFKTDSVPLHLYTESVFLNSNFNIDLITKNLHKSKFPIKTLTEFEEKYLKKGIPTTLIVAALK